MGRDYEVGLFDNGSLEPFTIFRPIPIVTQRPAFEGSRSNHASTAASMKAKCVARGATISMFIVHKATKLVGPPGRS